MLSKQELIDAIQAHKDSDALVHLELMNAVQSYDGDTKQLEKQLDVHIEKTDKGHDKLLVLANDL